jgi:hypothetical protein
MPQSDRAIFWVEDWAAQQVARADYAECHAACRARGAGVVPPCGYAA